MYRICFFLVLTGLLSSCEDTPVRRVSTSPTYVRINTFTKDKMTDQYFWADEVKDKEIKPDLTPEDYFATMKYDGDPWSRITKSRGEGEIAEVDGYDDGFGYNLTFWENEGNIIADVNFVYPHSPAAKAGLKRGDLITRMNGEKITTKNYTDLYYASPLSIGLSNSKDEEPYKTVDLVAQSHVVDPIPTYGLIPLGDKTIGYILYTSFVYRGVPSLNQLTKTLRELKENNIDELILDLRYNSGGYMLAAKHLCSLLAPEEVVRQEEVMIRKRWNNAYQNKYANDPEKLEERFDIAVPEAAHLDLPRLWVITSRVTASASELLISTLSAYMPVIVVGEKTVGKNMGGITFTPTESDLKDWNITLISIQYTNSNGESVAGGIHPHYMIQEPFHHQYDLGDPKESVLAATLQMIEGKTPEQDNKPVLRSRIANQPTNEYKRVVPESEQNRSILIFERE